MRKIWDIHGGIHPPENKWQSLRTAISALPLPTQIILPLSQHIGTPAQAIVNVGDHVLKGQIIAKASGAVSVPVHASSSGIISAIGDWPLPHPSGLSGPCISITPDGEDRWIEHRGIHNYRNVEKAPLLDIIRNAGIAGMGGAGFPTAIKLNPPSNKKITTLIINGTECEPYITADDALMRERASDIIRGISILAYLLDPTEILIGIEDNKPDAIAAMQKAAAGTNFEIIVFPAKYPSGGEKQLIQILTGKEVPAGALPADLGIICQNIGTAAAIYRAVALGEPLISRITTITGNALTTQQNFEVLLGTPISYLLEQCGLNRKNLSRLIMGGPMMGFTLISENVPIIKTTNCILAPTQEELPPPMPAQACIRCGMCAEVCPVTLLPQQLYWYTRAAEFDKVEQHHIFDCIECGACSYVCPSNIPLVQYYRAAKAEINLQQQEKINAETAKQRFEQKQARLAREEEEKDNLRKARITAKQNAAANIETPDPIAAAIERAKAKKALQQSPGTAD